MRLSFGGASKPVFILGVGAQKAGTSFLYDALAASPHLRLSQPKEMHVFDSVLAPKHSGEHHARIRRRAAELLEEVPPGAAPQRTAAVAHKLRHVRMLYDLGEYVAYFRELSSDCRGTGDITPAYSLLGETQFVRIRELLQQEFDLRVVFIMRDPLDRIYSAMRMHDRNTGGASGTAADRFIEEHSREPHRLRSSYEEIVPRLERVFGAEQVFLEFYERLFRPEVFTTLQRFLGVRIPLPDMERRVNASPKCSDIPRTQRGRRGVTTYGPMTTAASASPRRILGGCGRTWICRYPECPLRGGQARERSSPSRVRLGL
ncbi:MAG: sulfotransferase [Arhodomonas sp.]|nr:sulfotransferase [Arhodomonas sp.]